MRIKSLCGRETIGLTVPDDAVVYSPSFPAPSAPAAEAVLAAVRDPIGSAPLADAVRSRRQGEVVVVVSDITRPVPYAHFLSELLAAVEAAGVRADEILVLVATGMHRASTACEHAEMFGDVAGRYRILDHDAADPATTVELPRRSWAGSRVRLNRGYMQAGFRIVTGLVEPHFMAGFSGGRKAICPGLADLETIREFHGEAFMGNPLACNGRLDGNPCHEESLSVARMAPPDFCVNVVMDGQRRVVRAFAGEVEAAHAEACRFARGCVCPTVRQEADVVLTSSGGYPLDGTFYQCVKGLVACLPAVKRGGTIVAFGGCSEGIGSPEYAGLMRRYANRWREFLSDIKAPGVFTKDQWELQMQCRALAKVGQENLHFITDGLPPEDLSVLSVSPHPAAKGQVESAVQALFETILKGGQTLAVLPQGPYCAPLAEEAGS